MNILIAGDFNIQSEINIDKKLLDILKNVDSCILNFEGYFCNCKRYEKSLCMNEYAFRKFVEIFKVAAVSVANNHIMDGGVECFEYTIGKLKEMNIEIIGLSNEPFITLNGLKIYSAVWDKTGIKKKWKKYINVLSKDELFEKLKNNEFKDIDVLYIHWGIDGETLPLPWQVEFSKEFVESSNGIIIGHHSHTIQPLLNDRVFFSIGNLYMPENDVTSYYTKKHKNGMLISIEDNKIVNFYICTYEKKSIKCSNNDSNFSNLKFSKLDDYKKFFLKNRNKNYLPSYDGTFLDMIKIFYIKAVSFGLRIPLIKKAWIWFKKNAGSFNIFI